jgi:hypothetical protein
VQGSDRVFAIVTGLIETFSILGELTVEQADEMSFAKPSHRLIGYGMGARAVAPPTVARGGGGAYR